MQSRRHVWTVFVREPSWSAFSTLVEQIRRTELAGSCLRQRVQSQILHELLQRLTLPTDPSSNTPTCETACGFDRFQSRASFDLLPGIHDGHSTRDSAATFGFALTSAAPSCSCSALTSHALVQHTEIGRLQATSTRCSLTLLETLHW